MFADAARAATTNTIRNMVLKTAWRTVYIFIYLFLVFYFTFFLAEPTFYLLLSVAIKVLTNSFDNNKNSKQKRIEKGGTKNTAL